MLNKFVKGSPYTFFFYLLYELKKKFNLQNISTKLQKNWRRDPSLKPVFSFY